MLAIGRALMASPRVLLLDEPSLGLAPRIVEQLAEVIREINRQGVTVVLVEQNAAMALARRRRAPSCSRSASVALEGAADELAESDEVRERYLGIAPDARRRSAPVARRSAERASSSTASPSASAASRALSEVSFAVEPGSMHALIGPNGAGKSTCLNVLSGVYEASAGSVRYGDRELTAAARRTGSPRSASRARSRTSRSRRA